MKDHTTAEIFEELWKRIEYDANVSEELATESNELQARIDKAIKLLENYNVFCDDNVLKIAINVLRGIEEDDGNDE